MGYMTKEEFNSRMKKIQKENEQIELRNRLKAEKNKFKQSKIKTSNKVLIAAIIAIILFTVVCLYIQYHTGTEVSSTLITLWFSFWTVEIVSLASIKVSKVFKNYESASNIEVNDMDSINDAEDDGVVD